MDVGYDPLGATGRVPPGDGVFLQGVRTLAAQRSVWVVAGVAERDDDHVYDSAAVVDPLGDVVATYRKVHLFSPTGEDGCFTEGAELVVVECLGVRVGLAICYDLRFPELFRALALSGATLVAVPSAFPHARVEHWRTLLRARALENQLFVAAANRVGTDVDTTFCGASAVVGPDGTVLAEAEERGPADLVAVLDPREIDRARSAIPALDERRANVYARPVRVVRA